MVGELSSPRLLYQWVSVVVTTILFLHKSRCALLRSSADPHRTCWLLPCKGQVGLRLPAIFRSPGVLVVVLVCFIRPLLTSASAN